MADASTPRRPLTLDDLIALRTVSDPQISPDGQQVAFVVETIHPEPNETRSQIWLVPADRSTPPRPMTAGEKQDSQPRWSPDGKWLAFVSNRSGTRQIWVLPVAGGEPRRLTDHPIGASAPTWAPDSQRLAFVAPGPDARATPAAAESHDDRKRVVWVREYRHKADGHGFFGAYRDHLWVIPLADGAAVQLTDGHTDDADPAWSPDGRQIAFSSDRSAERDWHFGGGAIHAVDVATGQVRRLTTENGRAEHPAWSPDGQWLAYPGSDDPDEASPSNTRLWLAPTADAAPGPRCLTADLDVSVGQRPQGYLSPSAPAWLPAGNALLYLIPVGPSTHLFRVSTGEWVQLTTGRRTVHTLSVDRSGRRAALLVSDATQPPEVWLWDEEAGAAPLTAMNEALLQAVQLAAPEDRRIVRPDGTVVEGWLLRPTGTSAERSPLILSVHGGPHNYFGDTFSFDHQLFAASGYAVLYVNPRGSGGSTEAFARAVCEDWGGADFLDLLAMLDDTLAAHPEIDPARLGITGGSYGGFMTCWAVGQTDRFKAAVAGACVSNLASFFGTADLGATWGAREFGGAPHEQPEWYAAHSPITHVARINTPLLLYHGEADLRCPIEQSEQIFTALLRLGRTTAFLRLPGESHGALGGTPEHRLVGRKAILDWFAQYV